MEFTVVWAEVPGDYCVLFDALFFWLALPRVLICIVIFKVIFTAVYFTWVFDLIFLL